MIALLRNFAVTISLLATVTSAGAEQKPVPIASQTQNNETEITITLAGDTGLNGSFEPVYASFGTKHGMRLAWSDASALIAHEITGDINFANLETVVTDRNDLKANLKLFGFRTHPSGVRHLMQIGLNVFSTANNHAMDFGLEGARETLKQLKEIGVANAGLGANRKTARMPVLMTAKGKTFAIGALGIIGNGYDAPAEDEDRPGQLSYRNDRDFNEATSALAATTADYRILSVHYGQEFEVNTSAADRARLTGALTQGADLVVGHHHHVPNGIEIVGGKPVFYGLGNFMHWGTQDMSRFDICRDYGLVARVHLAAAPGEKPALRAIEALPITQMHKTPRRMSPEDGAARIQVLNHLAKRFNTNGVRFSVQPDGSGLYCAAGGERLGGEIGQRCAAKPVITPPAPELAKKIETACAQRVVRIVELDDEIIPEFATLSYEEPALPPLQ
ncbi:MAG: CapA family protein [Alphaproteobacteria bacterium]|nr:CapA family protein [Alphaproteobacteria bacterium]